MPAKPAPPSPPAEAQATPDKERVPAFSFPFNPAAFAEAKKQATPNYPGAGKSSHDKTPSRAPNGSRRSMGKR
ncbi:hypothetical protein [Pseudomonas sp. nanlin1]|uniref:hypothetical protein n=1 Tax=Pseudomonas sp. nanlin1 TaxID=3040605 RepID=UPI00388E0889